MSGTTTGGGEHEESINLTHGGRNCSIAVSDLEQIVQLLPEGDALRAVLEQLLGTS